MRVIYSQLLSTTNSLTGAEICITIPEDRIEHIKTVREAIDLIMELDSI